MKKKLASASLELKNAAFQYHHNHFIFQNLSYRLESGDIWTILGPNGAGKTTLLKCINHFLPLTKGDIYINQINNKKISVEEQALQLAYVPQISPNTFSYKVKDYIVMGRMPHIGLLKMPKAKDYEKVAAVMEKLKISHLAEKSCNNISGGEWQQVQIARVLIQETNIILMDEPTNHLDYGNQLRILEIIIELAKDGYIIILTTHMPDHAILLDGIVGLLQKDGKMLMGSAGEVLKEETLTKLYDAKLHMIYIKELNRMACIPEKMHK